MLKALPCLGKWIMNCVPRIFATAICLSFAIPQLYAGPGLQSSQTPPPVDAKAQQEPENTETYTYRISAELVNVDVLVTDEDGHALTGLKRGNFRVLDNGVPQQVLNFSPTSAPITIVVLMEYSAASYNYFASKSAQWSTEFLSHLEPRDWVSLVTFDMKPKVQVDFTHRQYDVRDAIASLGFPQFQEVNLYDALIDTLDKLERVRGRKSVLILATGLNSFSAANFDQVRDRVKRSDAVIFCIGLAEGEYVRYSGIDMSYLQGKNALTTFAQQTGGLALFPRFEGELPDIFRSVVGFLRSEYTLAFRPSQENRDGRYHRLSVEIVGPDGAPLKVTDEKGRRRKIEVFAREGYMAPQEVSR